MERIILDTNVVIAYFKGASGLHEKLQAVPVWCLPVTVVGELLFGAYNSTKQEENLIRYHAFVKKSEVLAIDADTADAYAQIRFQLRKAGRPIPENDIWIAATAKVNEIPLVTLDTHFEVVDGLKLFL